MIMQLWVPLRPWAVYFYTPNCLEFPELTNSLNKELNDIISGSQPAVILQGDQVLCSLLTFPVLKLLLVLFVDIAPFVGQGHPLNDSLAPHFWMAFS